MVVGVGKKVGVQVGVLSLAKLMAPNLSKKKIKGKETILMG